MDSDTCDACKKRSSKHGEFKFCTKAKIHIPTADTSKNVWVHPCKHLKITASNLQTVLHEINEKKIYDNYYSWFEKDFVKKSPIIKKI